MFREYLSPFLYLDFDSLTANVIWQLLTTKPLSRNDLHEASFFEGTSYTEKQIFLKKHDEGGIVQRVGAEP